MPVPTREQFQVYTNIYEHIAAALTGLQSEQLQAMPVPGEWSIHQIVVHLADSEAVGYARIRKTIAEDHPTLPAYDEETWTHNLYYHQQDPRLALEVFRLLRQSSTELLRLLPTTAWERTALHTENGEVSLYDLFQTYSNHGELHLRQIQRVKQSL